MLPDADRSAAPRSPRETVPPVTLVLGAENRTIVWCAVARSACTLAVAVTVPPAAALAADNDRLTARDGAGCDGGWEAGGVGVCVGVRVGVGVGVGVCVGGGVVGGFGVVVGGGVVGGFGVVVGGFGEVVVGLGAGLLPPVLGDGVVVDATAGSAAVPTVRTVAVPSATKIGFAFDLDSTR